MPRHTDHELIAYAAGELDAPAMADVEARLRDDPDARATVERYRICREVMADDDSAPAPADVVARAKAIFSPHPAAGWLDRLQALVAAVVYDSRREPALAGFRGSGEGFQVACESELAEIDLEMQPAADPSGADEPGSHWHLTGQVATPAPAETIRIAVALPGSGEAIAEATADDSGMFTVDIPAARYDLLVEVDGAGIVVPGLELG